MHLPDLSRLSSLTALNLSDNRLTRVPPMLAKLKQLRMLDMSCNQELQVRLLQPAALQIWLSHSVTSSMGSVLCVKGNSMNPGQLTTRVAVLTRTMKPLVCLWSVSLLTFCSDVAGLHDQIFSQVHVLLFAMFLSIMPDHM